MNIKYMYDIHPGCWNKYYKKMQILNEEVNEKGTRNEEVIAK